MPPDASAGGGAAADPHLSLGDLKDLALALVLASLLAALLLSLHAASTLKGPVMNGSKTYIACALALGYAAFAYFTGHIDAAAAGQLVETALIGAGIRHGVSTGA